LIYNNAAMKDNWRNLYF